MYRICGFSKERTTSSVLSSDALSRIKSSKSSRPWRITDAIASGRKCAQLKVGIATLSSGWVPAILEKLTIAAMTVRAYTKTRKYRVCSRTSIIPNRCVFTLLLAKPDAQFKGYARAFDISERGKSTTLVRGHFRCNNWPQYLAHHKGGQRSM